MGPQRVLVDVVGAFVGRLGQQADRLLMQRLSHGHEAAGFKKVVHGAHGAVGPGRAAFPCEGVAVPAVEGKAAAQLAIKVVAAVSDPFALIDPQAEQVPVREARVARINTKPDSQLAVIGSVDSHIRAIYLFIFHKIFNII